MNDENIKSTYIETMNRNNRNSSKWGHIKKFVKLTKSMKIIDIVKLIGDPDLKEGSFRKKYDAFKRVEMFLSYLHPNDYVNLELPISYFQKVKLSDWNNVLLHIKSSIKSH